MKSAPALTHADRAYRREKIARRYAAGIHPADVAAEFGVSRSFVNQAAQQHGVSRSPGVPGRVERKTA